MKDGFINRQGMFQTSLDKASEPALEATETGRTFIAEWREARIIRDHGAGPAAPPTPPTP